ncbi:MAG: DNA internalization-related competence protein ComEC/Rec2 [Burkholderiales bacterium]|nr:DNA internalization-related competence protein ComEC/Rec2 [Burkholderiales bacterium]
MLGAIFAFATGCWMLQLQARLPDASLLAAGMTGAAVLTLAARLHRHPVLRQCALVGAALLGGYAYAAVLAHARMADALPPEWEGRDIEIVGVVASLPQHFENGTRFEFSVERVATPRAAVPRRLLLSWYDDDGGARLRPGERWHLAVRLKRPHGSANPHGFDFEAWLLERGIRATGYVRPAREESPQRLLAAFVTSPGTLVDRARMALRDRLQHALAERAHAGVIIALAIGDQRAIDGDDWRLFTRTGVGHLMSISGLHVTMIAALAALLAQGAWRRSERLCLALPAQRAAAAIGLGAAFGYCLLAGFAIPAQRTLFMLAVAAWAIWRGWSGSGLRVLAIALAAVCLLDPWAPLSAGFWLSFAAVAVLMLAAARITAPRSRLHAAIVTQLAVTLGLLAPTLALFQQISLAGPFANAVAIPVVSFVVTPLALLACAVPLDVLAQAAHAVLALLMDYLGWLGAHEFAVWQRAAPPPWTVALALAGSVWLLIPWWWHWRILGAIWMLPLIVHPAPTPAAGDLWLTVLDVGQGLAVTARTRGHTLLVDAGPRYSPEADGGNRVIVPFLRGEGVRRLDGVVLTHDDIDHVGGAASTLGVLDARWLATSLDPARQAGLRAAARGPCLAGQAWEWDGVRFGFLHPAASDLAAAVARDNARSCVLSVEAHGRRILIAADIEADVEGRLVAGGSRLSSDLLVVPHHGSRTSSTEPFLDAVAPRMAIIPVGYRNRFRHPHGDVLQRYAARGIAITRTDHDGAVLVRISADGMTATPWRDLRRRYWHLPRQP